MTPTTVAGRAGLRRGWIEYRQIMTNAGELLGWLWPTGVALIVMYVLRGTVVPGTGFSLGAHAVPGILGMHVVFTAMMGLAVTLTMERDDGTLLRMKATPNGMLGYLTGKVVSQATMTIATVAVVLLPAALAFDGLRLGGMALPILAWVLALGLVATLPLGAVVGSLFRSPGSLGLVTLLIMGLTGISGVFYPITALPGWLQLVGQAFPVYWLGLGLRSALLPGALAVAEIGGSWRQVETLVALGAWAVAGFVVAPIVLRRMARRVSGASVDGPPRGGTR